LLLFEMLVRVQRFNTLLYLAEAETSSSRVCIRDILDANSFYFYFILLVANNCRCLTHEASVHVAERKEQRRKPAPPSDAQRQCTGHCPGPAATPHTGTVPREGQEGEPYSTPPQHRTPPPQAPQEPPDKGPVASPFTRLGRQPWTKSWGATARPGSPPPRTDTPLSRPPAITAELASQASLLDLPQRPIAEEEASARGPHGAQGGWGGLDRHVSDVGSEFRSCVSEECRDTLASGDWKGVPPEEILSTRESWRALFSDPHKPPSVSVQKSQRRLPPYLTVDLAGQAKPPSRVLPAIAQSAVQATSQEAISRDVPEAHGEGHEGGALDRWLAVSLATNPVTSASGMRSFCTYHRS